MRKISLITLSVLMLLSVGCSQQKKEEPAAPETVVKEAPAPETPAAPAFVTVENQKFIDPEGRHIILHGAAVISKNRARNYQPHAKAEDFELMRSWGMNCIRLGIIWDGLEPEMNQYDEEYLKKLDDWIALAKEYDMYVFIDMHQDLYSYKYSDGAPEWATLIDDQVHPEHTGAVWSDAYLTSPAIQRAFDNFWANKPCADGVGVQDHFAAAWKKVAERYADEPIVIGYDLFNEPNIGSGNIPAQEAMIAAFARAVAEKDGPKNAPTPEEVFAMWIDDEGRSKIMTRLKEMDIYTKVIDAAGPIYVPFERDLMTAMFQRVRDAIREVDPNHIIFLETSMSANMGIPTGVQPLVDNDGNRDPLQAYAPHGYDIVVDTADLALGSNERVKLIFDRHAETGQRLNMPVMIGEWGAYGHSGPEILPFARFVVDLFETHRFSDAFWSYSGYTKDVAYQEVLRRPIPERVNGTILSYDTDFDADTFTCTWKEDGHNPAPTRIYLPKRVFKGQEAVQLSPKGKGFRVEPATGDTGHVYIVIPPLGEAVERSLTVK